MSKQGERDAQVKMDGASVAPPGGGNPGAVAEPAPRIPVSITTGASLADPAALARASIRRWTTSRSTGCGGASSASSANAMERCT